MLQELISPGRSKFQGKFDCVTFLFLVIFCSSSFFATSHNRCKDGCINGVCVNGTCVCRDGWQGVSCQHCGGKIRLSEPYGFIHDSVGNYSTDTKCSWLIDANISNSSDVNSSIRLHIEDFSTECGWDYLYIFDGDSVNSPLLAVFSGIMYSKGYSVRRIPEVMTTSGYALIHFYSDVAVNMSGFNISYSLNSCPSSDSKIECSGNGKCVNGACICDELFTGDACDVAVCPNNCSGNGVCKTDPHHRCECYSKYKGYDCSQSVDNGYWEVIQPKDFLPMSSASHSVVVWRDSMYVVGGEFYNKAEMIYVYDLNGNVWETPQMDSKHVPVPRYGHSSVLYGDKIYIYGGMTKDSTILNELWAFDVSAKTWENITVRQDSQCIIYNSTSAMCGPLRSVGHTATLFTNKSKKSETMIVIFGYSPIFGFLSTVQEYHFGTREWRMVKTKGVPARGGYGHSSAWDPLTHRIYVYGGYVPVNYASYQLTSILYSYEPNSRTWKLLSSAPSARYLHTANFIDGLMLVFGGNTYNVTFKSDNSKCYSRDFLIYDAFCDKWTTSFVPELYKTDLARFGHSAITFVDGSLYIYGGFNGQMLNDIIKYTPGSCYAQQTVTSCLNARVGVKCIWDRTLKKCLPDTAISRSQLTAALEAQSEEPSHQVCTSDSVMVTKGNQCSVFHDCLSCTQSLLGCRWCPPQSFCLSSRTACKDYFVDGAEPPEVTAMSTPSECPIEETSVCSQQYTCQSCMLHTNCQWNPNGLCMIVTNSSALSATQGLAVCGTSCSDYVLCSNCTENKCMWCHTTEKCIDKNGYLPSFPYGQCREWTATENKCRVTSGSAACSYYKSCIECQSDPECGWCDDGTNTGLGSCLPGGNKHHESCSPDNWYFTTCPSCQCNGHSVCINRTNVCQQPCGNFTHGIHCDRCVHGYYGNPLNGGQCQPCECNGQATQCNPDTGKCYCTTKGIIGDHCEKCDTQNHYHGDPTDEDGSCFYELTIDYQFTFNLSKKEDRHFRQINFRNSPPKVDVDADFNIMCSAPAKMNVTVETDDSEEERPVLIGFNCTNFRTKFSRSDYLFGVENNITLTRFSVYVYDFHPPLWIQISFSQYPKLNLQQFFLTFSICFLLLLLTAAALWKVKQKFDAYRRRQRMLVEMHQMARRPFIELDLHVEEKDVQEDVTTIAVSNTLSKRKKDYPNPVSMEPSGNSKAAVLSFFVTLPTGEDPFSPPGQSGVCLASALVTFGNQPPRKSSIDTAVKTDVKGKGRKCTVATSQSTEI